VQQRGGGGGRGKFARRAMDQGARHRTRSDEDGAPSTSERGTWAVDGSAPPLSRAREAEELEAEDESERSAVIDFGLLAERLSTLDDATLLMVSEARAEALVGTAHVRCARALPSSLSPAPLSDAPAPQWLDTHGTPARRAPSVAAPAPPSGRALCAAAREPGGAAAASLPAPALAPTPIAAAAAPAAALCAAAREPGAAAAASLSVPPLAPTPIAAAVASAAARSIDLDALLALPLGSAGASPRPPAAAAAPFDLDALLAL
jgi:hypothetical protein